MQAKKRIAIVGLGENQKNLNRALRTCDSISLIAVCDINPDAVGRKYYPDVPFYSDYRALIKIRGLDYVYVSVEPQRHYEVASFFIEAGIDVLCEKPPTSTFDEYLALVEQSRSNGTFFNIVYHFRFSNEALWLKNHLDEFGSLIFSEARFHDPYFVDGAILEGREALGGCWIDSASNILSVWSGLFPLINPQAKGIMLDRDIIHGLPIKATAVFVDNGTMFSIQIEWTDCFRGKQMSFVFERAYVLLDFTAQFVYVNGEQVACFGTDRATPYHYINFFNRLDNFLNETQNIDMTRYLYEPRKTG